MLSALISEDAPMSGQSEEPGQPSPLVSPVDFETTLSNLLKEGPIQESALGDAINNVKVHWNQLLAHIIPAPGTAQPTHDHVKELSEYSVKQLKESCLDVTKEFHKASLEWQMLNPEESLKEDISDYKEAVDRQNVILNSTEERLSQTLERYKNLTRGSSFEK